MNETEAFVLPPGTVLEGYTIRRRLGSGGFGVTYLAEEALIARKVAIKEFFPRSLASRSRNGAAIAPHDPGSDGPFRVGLASFREEAKMLLNFEHPNIVPLLKYFEANGTGYIVMPFIEGKPLDALIANDRRLAQEEIDEILPPILNGLAAVHEKRILHRDIKPPNIFIRNDGRPILIDFGAARVAIGEQSKDFTAILTHGYAPMEQYHEHGNLGPWTDIYALGATLYRCIAGRIPPAATDRSNALARAKPDPLPALSGATLPAYRPGLLAAIMASLAFAEENRPQTVAQFRKILGNDAAMPKTVFDLPQTVPPASSEQGRRRPTRPRRRQRRFVLAAALGAVAIGGGIAVAASEPVRDWMARQFGGGRDDFMEARRANECDRLGAFEYSPHNVPGVRGVSFEKLRGHVEEALKACSEAANRFRREARFRVYLARAHSAKGEYAAGLALLRPFAEAGDPSSQTSLAIYYENGDGVPRNMPEALRLYELAVAQKYTRAMIQLSLMFDRGAAGEKSPARAVALMREAAQAGHAVAQNNFGSWHRAGRNVARDPIAALFWLRQAADRGHSKAMLNLGYMYADGDGVPKDDAQAVQLYRRAAEDGLAEAQYALGWMIQRGRGAPADPKEAVRLLRLAADQNHAPAINALGIAYQNGEGVERDLAEAVRHYRKAAELRDPNGIFNLGFMYSEGLGVARDYATALRYYREAAELGHAPAMNNLGVAYQYGTGVTRDYVEAVRWYRRAAEAGNREAQHNLGDMYAEGLGVEKDVAEAVRWYLRAAKQGYEESKKALERLGHKVE